MVFDRLKQANKHKHTVNSDLLKNHCLGKNDTSLLMFDL